MRNQASRSTLFEKNAIAILKYKKSLLPQTGCVGHFQMSGKATMDDERHTDVNWSTCSSNIGRGYKPK